MIGAVHLNVEQVENRHGVTRRQLQRWRDEGKGPPCIKLNRKTILYEVDQLDLWFKKKAADG